VLLHKPDATKVGILFTSKANAKVR